MALTLGTNCGFVLVAPTDDPSGANYTNTDNRSHATRDTAPIGSVRIIEIGWWCDNATEEANFEVGVYTDDAVNNRPQDVVGTLSQVNAKGITEGWKKVIGLDISITPGNKYWVAFQLDNTATGTTSNTGTIAGQVIAQKTVQTALIDPWGASDNTYSDVVLAIYAVYEVATPAPKKVEEGGYASIDWIMKQREEDKPEPLPVVPRLPEILVLEHHLARIL